jgi:integrase
MYGRTKALRITPRVLAFVIREYLDSDDFKSNAKGTQDSWGRELRFAAQPDQMGAIPIKDARPSLTKQFIDGFSDRPYKQRSAITALRQFEKWAILLDKLPRQIAFGIEMPSANTGHIPWEDTHVAIAEQHAAPHCQKAVTLAVNSGQRGSDLVRMQFSDLEEIGGRLGIHVVQMKTKKRLWVPFTTEFGATIKRWRLETGEGLILRRPSGIPWTRHKLTVAWGEDRDRNPLLAPLRGVQWGEQVDDLVLHGLRGTCCVRFCRKGLSDVQIGKLIGMSPNMVARYTRFSRQHDDALAAMARID